MFGDHPSIFAGIGQVIVGKCTFQIMKRYDYEHLCSAMQYHYQYIQSAGIPSTQIILSCN